ncbi:MAG: amine oxidase [Clostridiales bacterium 43-6]|nr:MAG: amine oxidase [Clostridiales bacterium 43-6]
MEGVKGLNLNSRFSFYPPQPNNPTEVERDYLTKYALGESGRVEDFPYIKKLLSPPPGITSLGKPGSMKGKTVGIIGGGLGGLSAAFELRKMGFDITVYDALKDRVGGRVYTYYFDEGKKYYGEMGPMRIPVSHNTVWHYINLFGLSTKPFIQYDPNAYVFLRNIRVRNDRNGENVQKYIYPKYHLSDQERKQPWQELFYEGIETPILEATPKERTEILTVKPAYDNKTLWWDYHSNMQFMEERLTQEAISLVTNFSPLLSGSLYKGYIDFIQEVYPVSLSYLYEIPGGIQQLPNSFYQSFFNDNPPEYQGIAKESLGRVNYCAGEYVDAISENRDGKVLLRHRNVDTHQAVVHEFDYVVCAIPFSTLRDVAIEPLFSDMKMRAIKELNYITAQKTAMLFNERFWEKEGIVGGASYTDLPVSSLWYPSDHSKFVSSEENSPFSRLPDEPGVTLAYNFNLDAVRMTNNYCDDILSNTLYDVERVHGLKPGYLDTIISGFKYVNWDKEPTFRGSLCFFTPEQKRLFSYPVTMPEYNGKVFFAGEHISGVHRWMEGAFQSGMKAANDLLLHASGRENEKMP